MGRYEELVEKRDGSGLTKDEADELGRLMAERRDAPYGNAENPPADVEVERSSTADDLQELQEEKRERERDEDIDETVLDRERKAGAERDDPPVA
jgi:hypothetical protein